MKKKIEKLTPNQEKQLIKFRQKWFNIGSCTEPADRSKAEQAISKMYEKLEKKAPRFIWVQSPATALLCCGVLKKFTKENMDSLRDSLWDSLWAWVSDETACDGCEDGRGQNGDEDNGRAESDGVCEEIEKHWRGSLRLRLRRARLPPGPVGRPLCLRFLGLVSSPG